MILLGACGGKNDKGEKARADYGLALQDSIEVMQQQIDSCNSNIARLNDETGAMLHDFTTVGNPREVGTYIIFSTFKDKYPLRSTGVVARVNDNGQFELVAALSGKRFDQIRVLAPDMALESEVVPNDQALNFRNQNLTTVLFTGSRADSIGALIADNALNGLKVDYLQGGTVSTWTMPVENADMITATYRLYSNMKERARLERRVPMLHEKINLLRAHKDRSVDSK